MRKPYKHSVGESEDKRPPSRDDVIVVISEVLSAVTMTSNIILDVRSSVIAWRHSIQNGTSRVKFG